MIIFHKEQDEKEQLTPEEKEEADKKKKNTIIAVVVLVIVVIIVVIIGARVNRNNSGNDEATEAPVVSSEAPPANTDNGECTMETFEGKEFIATLAVSSERVTAVELDYVKSVVQKAYEGLDFCDPYCRMLTSVSVEKAEVFDAAQPEGDCDGILQMTLLVDGTYMNCGEVTDFPGLLDMPASVSEGRASGGRRTLRGARSLQTCEKSCMEGASVPSEEEFASMVDSYVSVLGPVCGFISLE